MADVLKIFLIVVGFLIVFIGYWLAAEALFPGLVVRAQEHYRRPIATTLFGTLLAAPLLLVGAGLLNAGGGPAMGAGFVLLAVPASWRSWARLASCCSRCPPPGAPGLGWPRPQDRSRPAVDGR